MTSQKSQTWRPMAIKKESLHVEKVGEEVLVYNLEGYRVHCLNDAAVRVWKLCNGRHTVLEIAAEFGCNLKPTARELVVRNAIGELSRLGLVEAPAALPAVISRREMARRIGIGTAAAIGLPLITSIVAPPPAYAASCPGAGTCSGGNSHCCCNPTCHCTSNCGGACPDKTSCTECVVQYVVKAL
jgi:hypothetical protein